MGVTNFDYLPENQAAATLREAAQIAKERKAMQRMGGDSLRYFRTDDAGAFAWSGRLDTQSVQDASTGLANFLIILTSSRAPAFLASMVVEVEGSTDGVSWAPQPHTTGPTDGYNWVLGGAGIANAEPYKMKFQINIRGPYNHYRRFKVQALTTSPVSISVSRIL